MSSGMGHTLSHVSERVCLSRGMKDTVFTYYEGIGYAMTEAIPRYVQTFSFLLLIQFLLDS